MYPSIRSPPAQTCNDGEGRVEAKDLGEAAVTMLQCYVLARQANWSYSSRPSLCSRYRQARSFFLSG